MDRFETVNGCDSVILTKITKADVTDILKNNINEKIKIYPNPFSNEIYIGFSLIDPTNVEINITDMYGKKVKTIFKGHLTNGFHQFTWSRMNNNDMILPGFYICQISTPHESFQIKIFKTK